MERKIITETKTVTKEVYQANDGEIFDNRAACVRHEKEIDSKYRLKKLEKYIMKNDDGNDMDIIPIHFSAEFSEYMTYTWIRANNQEELNEINHIMEGDLKAPYFPYVWCVETEDDFEGLLSDYINELDQMKKITKMFWKNLGYSIEIRKENEN